MCGILFSTKKLDSSVAMSALEKIGSRGPDDKEVKYVNGFTFGFVRLSLMDLSQAGNQPFMYEQYTNITNGEIYNWKQLEYLLSEKGEVFNSSSDCEVIAPLYKHYGVDFLNKIDGEFAGVICEGDKYIVYRDHLGIRPLFYGKLIGDESNYIFASEMKAIIDLVDKVEPFPIGSYFDGVKFHKYIDICDVDNMDEKPLDEIAHKLKTKLEAAIVKRLDADAPIGFLLSGGLDCSIVCSVAAKHSSKPIKTFSIGMESDPIDLKYAKQVAEYLNTDHHEIIMTKVDVLGCVDEVIKSLETFDITTIRASIGMYLLAKWIRENTNIKALLTGEISDEIFGYKYTDYAPNGEQFQEESYKRLREIYKYDVLRCDRSLAANSLEARVPFSDVDFVKYALSINPEQKLNTYDMGKYLLRKAFDDQNTLPDSILWREKAAFSDAVGHSMVDYLKAYANSLYSDAEFETKKLEYVICPPISKESLYYREIFEKYYKGQGHVIGEFWMPNKSWVGEDVVDPSARVLKNYGNSGK